jgi:hypothetical protein
MKMKAEGGSETLVITHKFTRFYYPENHKQWLTTVCLFNDAFSVTHIILREMKGWYVNDRLQNVLKEAVVAYFKVLSQHLYGGTNWILK